MDSLFVEEVAASLVREFLSRKGLKKTCWTMDQERPRSDLSINSRNDLRKVLHLEFLYKENKAKENPLKTNLELITRYFLDHCGNTTNNFTQETPIPALSMPKKSTKLPLRCSETTLVNIYDLADEDASWRSSLSETSKVRHDNHDGDVLGNFVSSKRPPHKNKPVQIVPGETSPLAPVWEKTDKLPPSEPSLDTKKMAEKIRPRTGLIVRGMMSRPTANCPQDPSRKHSLKRSPTTTVKSMSQPGPHAQEEESRKVTELSTCTPAGPSPEEGLALNNGFVAQSSLPSDRPRPSSPPPLSSKGLPPRGRGQQREAAVDSGLGADRMPLKLYLPGGNARATQERLERAFKRQGSQPTPIRKNLSPPSSKAGGELDTLELEDVEDELIEEEVIRCPVPSVLQLQTASRPIDLSVAKDIKNVLFGSSFCCFNEEWKLQNFTFSEAASLKYGIVQNKGGPCGVLAAVQGCVLQKLLFEGEGRANGVRSLQPSSAQRTRCLALALADIVWRAGGHQRAVLALTSGTQQFSPTGKYKADGVLETLSLHSLTSYDELLRFLHHCVPQFEAGPYGCILLTVSAILSRTTELICQDFDVPSNHLIGAHGYCTQELVNLLLTGRAVSNVFNDVMELDSGDGSVTLLKGIAARSNIGFLSLFEHYNVCQVGCFLKTPRFPIWVVCAESHFSVLFSLQPALLQDWRSERLFDLYYYDGLANQEEQIRLTVDTTQTVPKDNGQDLTPPLELCIRTKWKGASVCWNGSDPIL
ncbi:probable ubiquitin carboxyl-terminal hydrolase MINDY-4 [Sorex fumeus]|uniref:probable ubiquitin carboxyl-terminal hydrolase MINDY-4 n=1 Tax=Sorex fumeus TaxID=62283 RepID=UPI0024AC9ABE|nr:probable ubiquitin carboxyl-terminal hydrolase MINDY-4 [Sorex fumeus]